MKTNRHKRARSNFRNKRQTQKRKVKHLRSKTYSKSKRSFQTGGKVIPLNWNLDQWTGGVFMKFISEWPANTDKYNFFKMEPTNHKEPYDNTVDPRIKTQIIGAFGISFDKSMKSVFVAGGERRILKIEIDVDKYRYSIFKLVNAVLKRLVGNEVIAFESENKFRNIANYDNLCEAEKQNAELKKENEIMNCGVLESQFLNHQKIPLKRCNIEFDIQFTQKKTTIISYTYTGVRNYSMRCETQTRRYTNLDGMIWTTYENLKPIELPVSVPGAVEVSKPFWMSGGEFHVSVIEFWQNEKVKVNNAFYEPEWVDSDSKVTEINTQFQPICEFDNVPFDEKKIIQLEEVKKYIKEHQARPLNPNPNPTPEY